MPAFGRQGGRGPVWCGMEVEAGSAMLAERSGERATDGSTHHTKLQIDQSVERGTDASLHEAVSCVAFSAPSID